MPIHILSSEVADKIAAGEVIERPASVVKELIENAIDAGATTIAVEVRQAGRRLIRVSDDGCGIPSAEVKVAFARHATSKLESVDDLNRIHTLGFRGEALASVAAVAQVTLLTRAAGAEIGARLRIEGSQVIAHEPSAHPRGTTLSVENLFYNVPARLKFLRSDATERKHIDDLVARYAMAYSGLRFSLQNDDRITFRSPGSGSLLDVLIEVYGLQAAQQMLEVKPESERKDDILASGYVSQPDAHRATRDQITLFVNGRWIQDNSLTFAVEQAYHTMLPQGRHPLAVLCIVLPPEEVDVNVHPTKSEVKFQRRDAVFRAVQRAVRSTLLAQSSVPQVEGPAAGGGIAGWQERRETLVGAGATQLAMDVYHMPPGANGLAQRPHEPGAPGAPEKLPPLRVIGQIAQTYIIAEGPQGLYLIDQHAAHERVLYEQLLAQYANAAVAVQTLLEPLPVELTPGQLEELELWLGPLRALGFEAEPFGGNTVLIRAIPVILTRTDIRQTLAGMLDELAIEEEPFSGDALASPDVHNRLAAMACKRGAVKAGQTLTMEEMHGLIAQLEQATWPRTCPHGRPTMILLSQGWMEKEFGRR